MPLAIRTSSYRLLAADPNRCNMLSADEFRVYWFEIFECVRKLALTGIPVWFEMGSTGQLTCGLLVSFISFGAYALLEPFENPSDDRLSQLCQAHTFFALLSSIILTSVTEDGPTSRNMGVLLCILTALPVGFAIWIQLYSNDQRRAKELAMLKMLKRFVVIPIWRWLMRKRDELGQKQRAREVGHKAFLAARASERRRQTQRSLADAFGKGSSTKIAPAPV